MKLGIIGGSGVYGIDSVETVAEHRVDTPFGAPSSAIIEGKAAFGACFFLARHGVHHQFLPSEVPFQANIFALKKLGVTHVLSVSAVGILADGIHPGEFVLPDQIIDFTKGIRPHTFYGRGAVGHATFGSPFCEEFRSQVLDALQSLSDVKIHCGGAYVCIEGPRFSSRAESLFFKNRLGGTVIGMTAMPEAALAREAGLSYAQLALGTDYDSWRDETATAEAMIEVLRANASKAQKCVAKLAGLAELRPAGGLQGDARQCLLTPVASVLPARLKELPGFQNT